MTSQKHYLITYKDKRNGHTYSSPVPGRNKTDALSKYGTPTQRRAYMAKVKVTVFQWPVH
jgi:hypothetical protein